MQNNDQQTIIECMWTLDQRCVGRAIRHQDTLTARGLKSVKLSARTINQQSQRQCEAINEEFETNCRTKKDFNTRSVMEWLLTSVANVEIKCQFETPHPDTIFQIWGLKIVLQDEERTRKWKK